LSLTTQEKIGSLGSKSLRGKGKDLIGVMLFANMLFNMTDLTTTAIALGQGLQEGNMLLLGMSAALGLSIFASLIIMKALIITGAIAVAVVGARSASTSGRRMALCYLIASTSLFYVISLNNLYWIVT
jgi:hypothetical protein